VATTAFAAESTGPEGTEVSQVIVTGTRAQGIKAGDSTAPVLVVGGDALKTVGTPSLMDSLSLVVPSFNTEAMGADMGNLVTSASLRGLNPNEALVMTDGKRRHTTGLLHVDPGAFQGSFAPDLGLIPLAAIDHVEVLEDGSSAQYGSDAIAGVFNIIMKKANHGGAASVTAGEYYPGDGRTGDVSVNVGLPLGDKGYVNLTAEERFHGHSQRGGPDVRFYAPDGTPLAGTPSDLPNAPRVNRIVGDNESLTSLLWVNAGYNFDGVEAYLQASYAHRNDQGYENYRGPGKIVADKTTLGQVDDPTNPNALIYAPQGFDPQEKLSEDDYSATGGLKGDLGGFKWDLSTTYGEDQDPQWTVGSANRSLFIDTHFTPTSFYDGAFKATEWTNNLDINRDFNVGFATPLNVAFGAEYRRDTFHITHGDPASIYKEGGQSFPGYQPTDAGGHNRTNWAGYVDLSTSPIANLKVDLAGRYETYSDFGDTWVGRLTARYDFSPAFAIRGTISSGFRAPTLAEEFYSATNVSPTFAVVNLPANSLSAKFLGFQDLKPEKSTNYTIGFVAHPIPKMTVTLDAYEIDITDRIVATGTILGVNGTNHVAQGQPTLTGPCAAAAGCDVPNIVNPFVLAAIAAHGNIIDNGVSFVGATSFTNGADTRTRGLDLTASYPTNFAGGRILWTFTGNLNETTITKAYPAPLLTLQSSLLNPESISNLTVSQPKAKFILNAQYTRDRWTVNLRETLFGPVHQWVSPGGTGDGAGATYETVPWTPITNLEVDYALTSHIKLAGGAINLLNAKPPGVPFCAAQGQTCDGQEVALVYNAPDYISPFGINGGYYYGRLSYVW
jgi:iron complex outermembrane receptor protein